MSWLAVSAANAGAASAHTDIMSASKRFGMSCNSMRRLPGEVLQQRRPQNEYTAESRVLMQALLRTILSKFWTVAAIICCKSVFVLRKTKLRATSFKRNRIADMVPRALGGGKRKDDLQSPGL